ncbi:hypothetical protein N7523_006860 [Penicillium sp. IBT 18751x]|nr:hypothetical protein N7523_006860 [Penicillium sp. IBT 18751x]
MKGKLELGPSPPNSPSNIRGFLFVSTAPIRRHLTVDSIGMRKTPERRELRSKPGNPFIGFPSGTGPTNCRSISSRQWNLVRKLGAPSCIPHPTKSNPRALPSLPDRHLIPISVLPIGLVLTGGDRGHFPDLPKLNTAGKGKEMKKKKKIETPSITRRYHGWPQRRCVMWISEASGPSEYLRNYSCTVGVYASETLL